MVNNIVDVFGFIFFVVFVYAFVYGVTIDGKHYSFSSCDEHHGVIIDGVK